jgi:hypothetical protein
MPVSRGRVHLLQRPDLWVFRTVLNSCYDGKSGKKPLVAASFESQFLSATDNLGLCGTSTLELREWSRGDIYDC